MSRDVTDNEVCILRDRVEKVVDERVEEQPFAGGLKEHVLQHICHNVEKEGGGGLLALVPDDTESSDLEPH
jgi:hypothetical protein